MKNLTKFIQDRNISTALELAEILKAEFGIKCRQEGNLYCFNYDQIESPKTHPVVGDCRGIVLHDDLTVAAMTPTRFFNLGEALEITDQFEWDSRVTVAEKADGSFIKIYFDKYENKWEIGTRGTCRAEVENYSGKLFRTLVLEALDCGSEQEFQDCAYFAFWDDLTYCFELISPENRVVTPYENTELVLLAAISDTGRELSNLELKDELEDMLLEFPSDAEVRLPKYYDADTAKELIKLVNEMPGLQEGVVLRDSNGLRIKLKSATYVAVHKLRGDNIPTPKRIAELVVTNETEEYLTYFPEERKTFASYVEAWECFKLTQEDCYNEYANIEDQKEFALNVQAFKTSGAMFQARKNKADFLETLNAQRTATLAAWLLETYTPPRILFRG